MKPSAREEKVTARLVSVNVGLPCDIAWRGKTVHTAIWKAPVQGRRLVRRLNIDGDGQGDLAGHGGEHRAIFVYQIDSYHYWQSQLSRNDFTYGQFGENFTVEGLSDQEVCIGDRYRVGGASFEVTQPRVTCYRVGIRMNEPQMAALLVAHGRSSKPGEFHPQLLTEPCLRTLTSHGSSEYTVSRQVPPKCYHFVDRLVPRSACPFAPSPLQGLRCYYEQVRP